MTVLTGLMNVGTGISYFLGVGFLSLVVAMRAWRVGNKRLAYLFLGLVGMATSCGPHHLHLGVHFLLKDYIPTTFDTIAILVAFPFGAAWLWWQTGAVYNKWIGDWFIPGVHEWPILAQTVLTTYVAVMIRSAWVNSTKITWELEIQLVLLVLYCIVGYVLWTAQLRRRRMEGFWSAKGLALAMIFPTCATQHAVYGLAVASGRYNTDVHVGGLPMIDAWGILVALYFVIVVLKERQFAAKYPLASGF